MLVTTCPRIPVLNLPALPVAVVTVAFAP